MEFFNEIILNIVCLLFPILLYFIYFAYNNNIDKASKPFVIDITNLISVYLLITYGKYSLSNLLLINIPLIISLKENRIFTSFIISIILVLFNTINFNFNFLFMLIEYGFYLLFFLFIDKKHRYVKILNYFTFFKGIVLSSSIVFIIKSKSYNSLIMKLFFILVIFYLIASLIINIIIKTEEITSLNSVLKDYEREKTLKECLFKITHEIKNPLAVALGYLSMMNYNDLKTVKKFNEIIDNELQLSISILEDFSEMNKIKVERDIMDINMLLEDIAISMQGMFKNNNITLVNNISKNEYFINGDYNKLKSTFINIIKNSVEAIDKDRGIIKIASRVKRNVIEIEFEDNGCGMEKDVLDRISEMFFTTKNKGTGLGIVISKEIINLHEGSLEYQSRKNVSTKAIVKLPKMLDSNCN